MTALKSLFALIFLPRPAQYRAAFINKRSQKSPKLSGEKRSRKKKEKEFSRVKCLLNEARCEAFLRSLNDCRCNYDAVLRVSVTAWQLLTTKEREQLVLAFFGDFSNGFVVFSLVRWRIY